MKVRIPEPVGKPVELYTLVLRNKKFSREGLQDLLEGVECVLDNLIPKIKEEFYLVEYNLQMRNNDNKQIFGDIMIGGFFINNFGINYFQGQYKSNFKQVIEQYDGNGINADIYVIGARDTISRTVDVKDPRQF